MHRFEALRRSLPFLAHFRVYRVSPFASVSACVATGELLPQGGHAAGLVGCVGFMACRGQHCSLPPMPLLQAPLRTLPFVAGCSLTYGSLALQRGRGPHVWLPDSRLQHAPCPAGVTRGLSPGPRHCRTHRIFRPDSAAQGILVVVLWLGAAVTQESPPVPRAGGLWREAQQWDSIRGAANGQAGHS